MTELDKFVEEEKKFWNKSLMKAPTKFICYITDTVSGEQVIPSYVIHTITRPTHHWWGNKKHWDDIWIYCYETLGDNILMKINSAKTFNLRVKELFPCGEVAEEWELVNCKFSSINPKPLSWQNDEPDILSLKCTINFESIKVNTNVKRK